MMMMMMMMMTAHQGGSADPRPNEKQQKRRSQTTKTIYTESCVLKPVAEDIETGYEGVQPILIPIAAWVLKLLAKVIKNRLHSRIGSRESMY